MKNIIVTFSEDVNKDVIKFLRYNKINSQKIYSYKKNQLKTILRSDIYITKYRDLPKFEENEINLKLIQLLTSDYSKIDLKFAKRKNIIVIDNLGANSTSVAEHTLAILLSILRNINLQNFYLKKGVWKNMKHFNIELKNKKLGIIGMGRIGSKVASRARAFGMDVFFNDIKKKIIKKNVKLYKFKNKNYIYKKCDFLSLHVDLNKRTKHLINKSVLKKMKKDAILINTSRGSVINEKELTLFLIKNKKFRVGLDVFDREN